MAGTRTIGRLLERAAKAKKAIPGLEKLSRDFDLKVCNNKVDAFTAAREEQQNAALERSHIGLQVNERRDALEEFLKRLLAAVESQYGDDSPEYEAVGGKRRSARKRPRRKAAPGAPASPGQ
jgi:hypothetical protein